MGGERKQLERKLHIFPSKGRRITDKLVERLDPGAYLLLDRIEEAARAHEMYINDRFKGSANVRAAELFRSMSVLHLTGVTRSVIKKALDNDIPEGIEIAIETVEILERRVLDSGFLKNHQDQKSKEKPTVQLTRIEFAEWEKEAHASWTENPIKRMHSDISQLLAEAAREFEVPLLTFDNLKKQPPPLASGQCG